MYHLFIVVMVVAGGGEEGSFICYLSSYCFYRGPGGHVSENRNGTLAIQGRAAGRFSAYGSGAAFSLCCSRFSRINGSGKRTFMRCNLRDI